VVPRTCPSFLVDLIKRDFWLKSRWFEVGGGRSWLKPIVVAIVYGVRGQRGEAKRTMEAVGKGWGYYKQSRRVKNRLKVWAE